MSNRKTFCEKYPELCVKDTFTNYRPTRFESSLGIERKPPPRRDITDVPSREEYTPPPRRNFMPLDEPNYRPRRNITPVVEPPPISRKDTMGLPVRRKPPSKPRDDDTPEIPESLLIAAKEAKEKLKEMKIEGLSKVGLGNEKVIESIRQHKYARLADVSYAHGYGDTEKANEIIRNGEYIPDFVDFKILPELSTKDYTILKNSTTGEVVMSLRGSDTKFADVKTLMEDPSRAMNVEDWWVNAHTAMGNPEKTQRYKQTTKAVREVASALGIEPSEIHFTGHSNGGGNARRQAEIFGAKATTFNGADNPLKDMTNPQGAKEGTEVKAYRTYGDVVSAGHERLTPEHMEVERLTAKAGTETNLIEQHGIEQFYHNEPKMTGSGEIENVRTGKVKNMLGTIGGTIGQGAFGIGAAEAFAPIYEDSRVEAKEQAFLFADTGKALAFDGMLDPGGTFVDLIQTMGMGLQPDEVKSIRHWLGLKDHKKAKAKDPAVIKWLKKLTGRAEQDKELEEARTIYEGNVSGRGVKRDPETGELREVSQEEQDDATARSQQFADTMNAFYAEHPIEQKARIRKQSPYGVNPYPIGSEERKEYQRQSLAWDENQRKIEAREDAWNDYWVAHPDQKIAWDAEQEASREAQRIDTRPRPTFKGQPVGGAFLGTYDSRPLSEQQSLQDIMNTPAPPPRRNFMPLQDEP